MSASWCLPLRAKTTAPTFISWLSPVDYIVHAFRSPDPELDGREVTVVEGK